MKFKKGDKVRILGTINGEENCEGVVIGKLDLAIHDVKCNGETYGIQPEALELIKPAIPQRVITEGYPKWMMVSPNNKTQLERLVIGEMRGHSSPFIAVEGLIGNKYLEGEEYSTCLWKYAKEIEIPTTKKMTVKEISDKLGYEIEIVKG